MKWFCSECGVLEDFEEAKEHEEKGHKVKGRYVPDRLLTAGGKIQRTE